MTTAIFWRFVWKEYRALRGFWISMGCLALLAQLALVAFPHLTRDATYFTFCFALVFPALYAVACGATMFAAEHEDETYEFIHGLPVSARQILSGKLTNAVASTLLLIALLWWFANALSHGRFLDGQLNRELWGIWGLAAVEGLAWGMLLSLLLKRPLQAAVLAIAAASLGIHLVVWSIAPVGHRWNELGPYLTAVPYRAVIAALVLFIDVMLADRWLRPPHAAARGLFQVSSRSAAKMANRASLLPLARAATFGRLVWQTWRQSGSMMATLAGIGAAAALLVPFDVFGSPRGEMWRMAVVVAVASLMGSCVFLADQERYRLRFLAEQGVRPRYVWLSRQFTWLAMVAIWALVVHGLWFAFHGGQAFWSAAAEVSREFSSWDSSQQQHFARAFVELPPLGLSLGLVVVAFTSGQLASMLFRSGILAGFVGLVLTIIFGGWALLMQLLEVNWLWSVAPIPLALLFATWLRTPDWILERNHWRGWLPVGASLVVPAAAAVLLVTVPLYRVYQIPDFSPGFSSEEYARSITPTPQQRETADMYRRAGELLVRVPRKTERKAEGPPDAEDVALLNSNSESLAMVVRASKRPDCSFGDLLYDNRTFLDNSSGLRNLLQISARELEAMGKLDDAWDRYLAALRFARHLRQNTGSYFFEKARYNEVSTYGELPQWAAQSGQTSERIVAAIKQLEELEATLPHPSDAIKSDYLRLRRSITGGPNALAAHGIDELSASRLVWWALMPWERSRALRLLNVATANDLKVVDGVSVALADGTPFVDLLPYPRREQNDRSPVEASWLRTTFLLSKSYYQSGVWMGSELADVETCRRATHLVLALEAWKVDHHGELPQRLSQLVGLYINKLPLDPYSGRPFRYVRDGLAPPPKLTRSESRESSGWFSATTKPFIWSTGERVRFQVPRATNAVDGVADDSPVNASDVFIIDYQGRHQSPTSDYELWLSGRWFEIP